MTDIEIFTLALGLEPPFEIKSVAFKSAQSEKTLHIEVGYQKGTTFEYEGEQYSIYDHQERTWRHLNFFQHECYLHCRVPRIKTTSGQVRLVEIPWSVPYSSFTLLFEGHIVDLMKSGMSFSGVGHHLGIGDKQVAGVIKRHVMNALIEQPLSPLEDASVDETSSAKGHKYLTILSDSGVKKVIGISEGKDAEAVKSALQEAEIRGVDSRTVKTISMDMSPAYIRAAADYFESADIVFDRFHLMQNLNKQLDQVRKQEQSEHLQLKKTKYLWLRNQKDLDQEKQAQIQLLSASFPTIGTAHRLKELFRQVLDDAKNDDSLIGLETWKKMAWNSGIEPIQAFVNLLNNHWFGIVTYFQNQKSNAFAERVNLKIQEIKRVAMGFRNMENFKFMIYFHLGGLNLYTH